MSGEPDDPRNPHRARPPGIPNNPEHGEIKRMVDHFDQTVGPFLSKNAIIPNSLREFLAYAFIAETGLSAKDCALVSEVKGGQQRWWYENRWPSDPAWKKHMMALEAENDYLKKRLRGFMEPTD